MQEYHEVADKSADYESDSCTCRHWDGRGIFRLDRRHCHYLCFEYERNLQVGAVDIGRCMH